MAKGRPDWAGIVLSEYFHRKDYWDRIFSIYRIWGQVWWIWIFVSFIIGSSCRVPAASLPGINIDLMNRWVPTQAYNYAIIQAGPRRNRHWGQCCNICDIYRILMKDPASDISSSCKDFRRPRRNSRDPLPCAKNLFIFIQEQARTEI